MFLNKFFIPVLTLISGVAVAGPTLELGVGKALNNTDSRLPGYVGSIRANIPAGDRWGIDAAYTKLGKTQLGADGAISTLGATRVAGRVRYGLSAILGASYSPKVWWDRDHPDRECGAEGKNCDDIHPKRYDNDGTHYSRSCHLCGGDVSVEYSLDKRFGIRFDYYGLRHMTPTFQGVVVQFTYTIGKL